MDIVRIIKFTHLKASFATLAFKHKFFLIVFLFSLITTLLPHETYAAFLITDNYHPVLVFDTSNGADDYLVQISQDATDRYYQQQLQAQAAREAKLTVAVQGYLKDQGSPLADYASTLITLRNWKKIVALANAESSLCRNYPTAKANCWGVGGPNLWDMGDNLGQGIVAMNHFLNEYPKGSPVKYSQMSFARMNGLYKQPPADHWVRNAQTTYDDLTNLDNSL